MKGFTLVETLVSVILSAIAMLFIASIWVNSVQLNQTFEMQADAEKERWTAEAMIRSAFAQAVDLTYAGNHDPLNFFQGESNFSGAIREFDSDAYWTEPTAKAYTLAAFHRDEARSEDLPANLPNIQSQFHTTGLYFQKPTVHTWGALYLDLGEPRTAASNRLVRPEEGVKLEGLLRVRIRNIRTYNMTGTSALAAYPAATPMARPVAAFDLEMTFRKYIGPQKQERFVFCPEAQMDIPPCVTKIPYRDTVKTIRLIVRNNVLATSPTAIIPSPLPPAAPLTVTPVTYGGRVYDRIHFFKPKIVKGLM